MTFQWDFEGLDVAREFLHASGVRSSVLLEGFVGERFARIGRFESRRVNEVGWLLMSSGRARSIWRTTTLKYEKYGKRVLYGGVACY